MTQTAVLFRMLLKMPCSLNKGTHTVLTPLVVWLVPVEHALIITAKNALQRSTKMEKPTNTLLLAKVENDGPVATLIEKGVLQRSLYEHNKQY